MTKQHRDLLSRLDDVPQIKTRVEKFITHGKNFRQVTASAVLKYVEAMKAGRWHVSESGIAFTPSRELWNGQHRMLAVVIANIPVQFFMLRGIDNFPAADTGKPRTVGQYLQSAGEENATELQAALFAYHVLFICRDHAKLRAGAAMDPEYYVNLLNSKCKKLRQSVKFAKRSKTPGLTAKLLAPIHFEASKHAPKFADYWLETIITGANLKESDPIFLLRRRFGETPMRPDSDDRDRVAALLIKSYNWTKAGRSMKGIGEMNWSSSGQKAEPFPELDRSKDE